MEKGLALSGQAPKAGLSPSPGHHSPRCLQSKCHFFGDCSFITFLATFAEIRKQGFIYENDN